MKFLIFSTISLAFFFSTFIANSAEKPNCFNVEKWKEESNKNSTDKKMTDALIQSCHVKDDEAKSRACMRKTIESYLNIDGYKEKVDCFAISEAAITKINTMIDECKNSPKKFFPCIAEKFEAACPELKGHYNAEVRKLGYDI